MSGRRIRRPRVTFAFDCPKWGHTPLDIPVEHMSLGDGGVYAGHVCAKCGGVYYERVGDVSSIVNERGGAIVTEG